MRNLSPVIPASMSGIIRCPAKRTDRHDACGIAFFPSGGLLPEAGQGSLLRTEIYGLTAACREPVTLRVALLKKVQALFVRRGFKVQRKTLAGKRGFDRTVGSRKRSRLDLAEPAAVPEQVGRIAEHGDGPGRADDEAAPRRETLGLANRHGRYGFRRMLAPLRRQDRKVNRRQAERISRGSGLRVVRGRRKRGRSHRHDGSCARSRPRLRSHVWSCGIVWRRLRGGGTLRFPTVMDEHGRGCLAIRVDGGLTSRHVPEALPDLFSSAGTPGRIRSDNRPDFTSGMLRKWLAESGIQTAYGEPGYALER